MEILAVLVVTLTKTLEEVTNRHLGHFVLVKELALVSFLAQVSHPVLAHDRTLSAHVPKRTVAAARTDAVQVKLAQSCLVLCGIKRL